MNLLWHSKVQNNTIDDKADFQKPRNQNPYQPVDEMKTLLNAAIILGLICSAWGQGLPEIRGLLEKEGGAIDIAKLIQDSPEVRQRELVAIIVKLVRDDLAQPPPPNKNSSLVGNASYVFIAAGDEQAILDAFKDGIHNTKPGELFHAVMLSPPAVARNKPTSLRALPETVLEYWAIH